MEVPVPVTLVVIVAALQVLGIAANEHVTVFAKAGRPEEHIAEVLVTVNVCGEQSVFSGVKGM